MVHTFFPTAVIKANPWRLIQTMISVRNFSKSYGNNLILTIPSLDLAPGIHWFRGENGSGKSTFFKAVAGLIPFKGDITLAGIDARKHPVPYRHQVAYAEAEPQYPGFVSPRDLALFVAKARNAERRQLDELVEILGIRTYYTAPCQTFSSGMLKKISLVLAFLGQPRVVILDEPLITLDVASRQTLLTLIKNARASGISFLLSSHQEFEDPTFLIDQTFRIVDHKLIPDA